MYSRVRLNVELIGDAVAFARVFLQRLPEDALRHSAVIDISGVVIVHAAGHAVVYDCLRPGDVYGFAEPRLRLRQAHGSQAEFGKFYAVSKGIVSHFLYIQRFISGSPIAHGVYYGAKRVAERA